MMRHYYLRFTYLIRGETVEELASTVRMKALLDAAEQGEIVIHAIWPQV